MAKFKFSNSLLGALLLSVLVGCGSLIPMPGYKDAIRDVNEEEAGVSKSTQVDANAEIVPVDAPKEIKLTPADALELAFRHSRGLQAKRDSLAAAALDVLSQRRAFGPRLAGDVSGRLELSGEKDGFSPSGNVVLSDILPTAAKFRVEGSSSQTLGQEGDDWNTRIQARLDQPLFAGAGYEASHEALIQAERDLVRRLRQFEMERQDLAIEILEAYYRLVGLRSQLENARTALERSEFSLQRSEAMFKVQLAPYIDVARSEQQVLASRRRLEDAQFRYDSSARKFLVQLSMPPETTLEIESATPEVIPLLASPAECVAAGMARRLDIRNALDSVEDVARRLRTAKGNRWPDLALFAEAGKQGRGGDAFQMNGAEESSAVGLVLQVNPDRRDQRDAVERARIQLRAAERDAMRIHDEAQVDVYDEVDRLATARRQVTLGEDDLAIARRRYENAMLRFQAGELGNRDVVEAENGLLDARNALVDAAISHETARIRLLARMGLLDIGPEGALLDASGAAVPPELFGPPEPLRISK